MTQLDVVLTGGTVVDGSPGAEPYVADVGLVGGIIDDLGDLSTRGRRATVDAVGRVVAPGFVDTHTHAEIAALRNTSDRLALVAQGVTTTMVGADGFGWVGLPSDQRRRWWEDTAAIYGPPLDPIPAWTTPAAFLADLRAASPTSVIPLVPHGNIRAAVMGARPGPPSSGELDAMRQLTEVWMDAGAVGIATGLDYLPGRFAETDELVALCETVVERGGVYATHLRRLDAGRAEAWREAGDIGRKAGIPIRVAHERLDDEGAQLLDEISVGNDVAVDTYLYPAGCTSLAYHVPPDSIRDGVTALSQRLQDPTLAADLAAHLQERLTGLPGQYAIVAATTSGEHEGLTLSELASRHQLSVGEMAVTMLSDEMPCALLVYVWQGPDATWDATVAQTLADPRTIIATDGIYNGASPHPRGFGTYPRILGEFVRDRGLSSLATAIHKMSGGPAAAYGLDDRGVIEPGRCADLVMLDPNTVAGSDDFEHPRTAPRGIEQVWVHGRSMIGETAR